MIWVYEFVPQPKGGPETWSRWRRLAWPAFWAVFRLWHRVRGHRAVLYGPARRRLEARR